MSTRDHARCEGCGGCATCGVHTKGATCNGTVSPRAAPGHSESAGDPFGPGGRLESVTLPRYELDQLLAVATIYVNAFEPDEMMDLPAKLMLQEVEAILERYGRRSQ